MKFNAHLLQSQTNKGDIGQGVTTTPYDGKKVWSNASAATSVATRDFVTFNQDDVDEFSVNVTYKNAFVQKMFCPKKTKISGQTRYLYSTFFNSANDNSPMVEMHELPAMGQVADYLLKPSAGTEGSGSYFHGGLMSKFVGNHFADQGAASYPLYSYWTDYYTADGSHPAPTTTEYNDLTLYKKIDRILNIIINNNSSAAFGFKIHAEEFLGGSQVIASSSVTEQKIVKLLAGLRITTPSAAYDYEVVEIDGNPGVTGTGHDDNWKTFILRPSRNTFGSITRPFGISGELYSGEYLDDFGTGNDFTFVDVERYYLRRSTGQHKASTSTGDLTYLHMTSSGEPQFLIGSKSLSVLPLSAGGAFFVHTKPLANTEILNYNAAGTSHYNFLLSFKSQTRGLVIKRTDLSHFYNFKQLDTKNLSIESEAGGGGTISILLKLFTGGSPSYASDYHLLTSEGEEQIYIDASTGGYKSFLKFINSNDLTKYSAIGFYKTGSSYAAYLESVFSSISRKTRIPELDSDAEFLVNRISGGANQTVYGGMNFLYIGDGKSIQLDTVNKDITNSDPAGSIKIENVEHKNGRIISPNLETPIITTKSSTSKTSKIEIKKFNSGSGYINLNSHEYIISGEYVASCSDNTIFILATNTDLEGKFNYSTRPDVYAGLKIIGQFQLSGNDYTLSFDGILRLPDNTKYTAVSPLALNVISSSSITYKFNVNNSTSPTSYAQGLWFYIDSGGDFKLINKEGGTITFIYFNIRLISFDS